jgi:uncharacterized OB-fold protein
MTATPSKAPRFDLPTIEDESRPFWDAARNGELLLKECGACGKVFHYPRPFCPHCWSEKVAWRRASGRATLYTFSTVHVNDLPPFKEMLPYVAAIVDLEEGVRMTTQLTHCDAASLRIGMPLEVAFRPLTDDIVLPVFRPAAG